MTSTGTYSGTADLWNDPTERKIDGAQEAAVRDATNEIDAMIGRRYLTPIDVSEGSSVDRSVRLLIKTVAIKLSSGRYIMRVTDMTQNNVLHAYGNQLVKEAMGVLNQIVSGEIILTGVDPAPSVSDGAQVSGKVFVHNPDPIPLVDSFYEYTQPRLNPLGYPSAYPYR